VSESNFNNGTPSQASDNEEEHEDVRSFVAETENGSKSKKSSGDSKGSRTLAEGSKVSSREDRKHSIPQIKPPTNSIILEKPYVIDDYMTDNFKKKSNNTQLLRRDSYTVY
jgi:hypothetical protein